MKNEQPDMTEVPLSPRIGRKDLNGRVAQEPPAGDIGANGH
jgi:hypothetical protein